MSCAPEAALDTYAEGLLAEPGPPGDDELLLSAFRAVGVSSQPYAYALDVTGESTLPLIEADPFQGQAPTPLLSDGEWLSLQAICQE